VEIVHADDTIGMDEHATEALKRKESSIYKAVELVRSGKADGVVSAGHSGATMSLATLRIGRLKNVSRPAIATLMPTYKHKKTLVLDVGANVDCKPENLFEFGVMGEAYAKAIMKNSMPKVGLLSNGEEETKGNELTKASFKLLKKLPTFIGNVEGNNIFDGSVDVVVCDGFTGNILLKTGEGVADAISKLMKESIKKTPIKITPIRRNLIYSVFMDSSCYFALNLSLLTQYLLRKQREHSGLSALQIYLPKSTIA